MTHDIDYSGQLRRKQRPRFPWVAALICIGIACLAYGIGRASAADRTLLGSYDLNAYRPTRDLREDAPNIVTIATYDSREECRHASQFVRVADAQMKWWLRCDPADGVTR